MWEEGEEEGEGGRTEVEMKWNICKYLPEAASCQDIFRVSPSGITDVCSSPGVDIEFYSFTYFDYVAEFNRHGPSVSVF